MKVDIGLITVVSEDLDYLTQEWGQNISDASLRRSSPVFRKLLCDDYLIKAARMVDFDVRILTLDKTASMLQFPWAEDSLEYYQSGGAIHNGILTTETAFFRKALTDREMKEYGSLTNNSNGIKYCPTTIHKFKNEISFIINGLKITREDVIKYVANKLGGTHYDTSREKLIYEALDSIRDRAEISDKNCIYYSFLSIGQLLIKSKDILKFNKRLKYAI